MTLSAWLVKNARTLESLAAKTGLDVASLSRIANGKQIPSVDHAQAIERATDGEVLTEDLARSAARVRKAREAA